MAVLTHYVVIVLIGTIFFATYVSEQAVLAMALALAILLLVMRAFYVERELERLEERAEETEVRSD